VAIHDVAKLVAPGSAPDREAARLGNSVYFPDRVVPRLPQALSNGLCSLVPGSERACLAAELWIDAAGRKRRHRFERAIMRCLEADPSRRPPSAVAVSAALPGGNQLAAAVAAGETPSPEMVAAAGAQSALAPAIGLGLVAFTVAMLVFLGIVSQRYALVHRIPMPKSIDALSNQFWVLDEIRCRVKNAGDKHLVIRQWVIAKYRPLVRMPWIGRLEDQRRGLTRHTIVLESLSDEIIGEWDVVRVERAIANLLVNAVKYSPSGGQITLRAWRDGDLACFAVSDEGMGIPERDVPHIFERFHRGRNVIGSIGGTGIGLSAARQIVEQHGGTIAVDSREGVGSTFTVRLPLQPVADSHEAE